jgi:hypothetical protein
MYIVLFTSKSYIRFSALYLGQFLLVSLLLFKINSFHLLSVLDLKIPFSSPNKNS